MQGRTIELATCLVQGSGVLMLVSPGQAEPLIAHLQKYILYGDEVRYDVMMTYSYPVLMALYYQSNVSLMDMVQIGLWTRMIHLLGICKATIQFWMVNAGVLISCTAGPQL